MNTWRIGEYAFLIGIGMFLSGARAEEAAAPQSAQITTGMRLADAIELLKSSGLAPREVTEAIRDPEKHKIFIVLPLFQSKDALRLTATAEQDGKNPVVDQISWHVDFADDSQLPKFYRANRYLRLNSIDVAVLQPNTKAKDIKRGPPKGNPFE